MSFKKGESGNPSGRKRGSQNRATRTFREAMLRTFADLGGHTHLLVWAKEHPSEFYKLMARFTPPGVPVRLGELVGTPADQGRYVMEKLAAGEISPEQAAAIMQCVTAQVRIHELDEIDKRLSALEARGRRT
jgi:hypothetical protein